MTQLILWIVGILVVAFAILFGLFGLVAAKPNAAPATTPSTSY